VAAVSANASHYHILIVGTDLAGLIYGALCAKRGYRVLIIGQGQGGALYEHGGHTLCRRLELDFGLQGAAAKRVFDELSMGLELRNLPRPLEPSFQVVLPRARIDVSTDGARMEREFGREFPGLAREIDDLFRRVHEVEAKVDEVLRVRPQLPPSGLIETFKFRSLVKKYPILDDEWAVDDPLQHLGHGHPLRALVHAPFRFASGMVPARPYPATFVRAIAGLWRGTTHFEGGPNTLRDRFEAIVASSGDVRPRAQISQVHVQRGRVKHVVLRDRREQISCDLLVCNMEPKRFATLIPQEQQIESYHHVLHTLQPIAHTFTANFVVRSRAIPEAMARHVFAVHDLSQSLEEDNLLHIARDVDIGAGNEERELRLVTAAMRVPISLASAGPAIVEPLLDRVQRRVEQTLPFLGEHLVLRHAPWLSRDDEGRADLDPAEFQPAYGEAIAHTLGTSPLATQTAYKNLLMGGDASFCGLGPEGPYLTAWNLLAHTPDIVKLKSGF
jgi:phytoene dehydrogenase-like protein